MEKLKALSIKLLKWTGKFVVIAILLITILLLLLRLPFVQRYITQRAIDYYAERVNTPANLEGLYLDFPTQLVLSGLYLEDQSADTLVYLQELRVSTNVLGLFRNELWIDDVAVTGINATLKTDTAGVYNFQYIVDAFSSEPDTTKKENAGNFGIYVGGTTLESAEFTMLDPANGIDLDVTVDEVRATTDVFDLDSGRIVVDYAGITGANARLKLYKGKKQPSLDTTASGNPFRVEGEFGEIRDSRFRLKDEVSGLTLDTSVDELQVEIDTLDIVDQVYLAKNVNALNPYVSLDIFPSDTATEDASASNEESTYSILAGVSSFQLLGGEFRFWDHSKTPSDGFDPMHMWFNSIDAQTENARFMDGEAWANITKFTANDSRSAVSLKALSADVVYTRNETSVHDFNFRFNNSTGAGDIQLNYPELEDLYEFSNEVALTADVDISIHPSDIEYFITIPEEVPGRLKKIPVELKTSMSGRRDDLEIATTMLHWGESDLQLNSALLQAVENFPASTINIQELSVKAVKETVGLIAGDSLADVLPERMNLMGTMKYAPDSISANAVLTTSEGDITLNARARRAWDSVFTYRGTAEVRRLNLQKLVPDAGLLSLSGSVAGKGLTAEEFISSIDLDVDTLQYAGYTYRDLTLNGTITEDTFEGQASYNDDNLDFDFDGYAGLPGHEKNQRFDLHLERADLQALGLVEDEFRIVGDLDVDLVLSRDKDLTGIATITNLGLNREGTRFDFERIVLNAEKVDSVRNVVLESGFMNAELHTTFPIPQLAEISTEFINSYLQDTLATPISPHYFSFNAVLLKPEFLSKVLLPDLKYIDISPITGEFNGPEASLRTEFEVDSIAYGSWMLDSLKVNLLALKEDLSGGIKLKSIQNGRLKVENASVDFKSKENSVDLVLNVKDEIGEKRYELAADLSNQEDMYRLSLDPERVMLNYEAWQVPASNAIEIHPGVLWFEDFRLEQDSQSLSLNSEINDGGDSLLVIEAQDFELSEVVSLTEDSIPPVSGILNGRVDIQASANKYGSDADVTISDFTLQGFKVGNLKLTSQQASSDRFDATLNITGAGNDLNLVGSYQGDGTLSADLDVNSLQLDPLEALSNGTISRIDGNVTGGFDVKGTVASPELNGSLNFDGVQFEIDKLKSTFNITNQTLRVEQNQFVFNDFTLSDEGNRYARIDGKVKTEDFLLYDLDMRIVTDSFTLLDSKKEDNPLLYGKVGATSELEIKGTSALPKITLDLKLSDDSKVTYVIPESTIAAQVQSDVIRFVDKDSRESAFLNEGIATDTIRSEFRGLDLKAVINVSSKNELKIVVDPITGDALTVKGDALLNLAIRPSGDITLNGRYEVKEGAYSMDFYGLVKREFKIKEGSFIVWTGDLYKAILNVTASYQTRAKPVQTDYDRLDFKVDLLLNGEILEPEIKFRLGIVEGTPAPIPVQSWIAQMNQDEAQVNKQAFGLLIFNSFFDDTANNWYDNLAANTARSSVSSLLSAELNKLSDKIDGVELSFDIDSYEDYNQSGENIGRTQLELGISKNLFNDRVIVKFAGNFDLEGASAYKNNVSDFSGDIRIEYLLTEDGRYRLVGFRESNYDDLLQGEIIKTGAGFIFVRDYDALKELFERKEKKE